MVKARRFISPLFVFAVFLLLNGCQTVEVSAPVSTGEERVEEIPPEVPLLPGYLYPVGYQLIREQYVPPGLLVGAEFSSSSSLSDTMANFKALLLANGWTVTSADLLGDSFLMQAEQAPMSVEIRGVRGRGFSSISLVLDGVDLPESVRPVPQKQPIRRKEYRK